MKKVNFLLFGLSLVTTTALANLNVIADIGGEDASPYFEGINRQGDAVAPPSCRKPLYLLMKLKWPYCR